jgi:molybdenum cofactor cytidylyltransferase
MILSAGYSSRMNAFKPLLLLNGLTVLETAVRLFQKAGIQEILAVLGHRADEVRPVAESAGARPIVNSHFDQGMFSSVRAGAAALPASIDACFVLPVDTPLVRTQTIRQMAAAFDGKIHRIFYPVFTGRRGHPPLVAAHVLREAETSPGPLSALLAGHENEAADIAVADEAIHFDMNTAEDYARLRALALTRDIPSAAECEAILASFSVPAPLLGHCRAVASTALQLVTALGERGTLLNSTLVNAGALLHDVAKGRPHHAQTGAARLQSLGFPRVAAIVASHMDLDFSGGELNEAAIVFLADKLIRGTKLVSLAQRFGRALEHFRDNPEALAAARRRFATAQAVAAAVEIRLGQPLTALFGDICH